MYFDAFTITALIITVFMGAGIVGLCSSAGNRCASGSARYTAAAPFAK